MSSESCSFNKNIQRNKHFSKFYVRIGPPIPHSKKRDGDIMAVEILPKLLTAFALGMFVFSTVACLVVPFLFGHFDRRI